ncbi:MAG: RES family NAD+ phosphorylase [Candidatus Eremiobacteraeota bacterium]|nr:RES family NAD+ phosphorylase [Candidatus Eremiobacteraeota bacterium]MBV8596427.1 RES family NAD+ phosphorylase [Candidatus Eremiobacteraeota bacterium]MBV8668983.1 RES family NAD+ phosphorylase [Candidatus Eremiobacteraeota bacterium]MBV8671245.1 RES family NAD+ phosphorylase [Candidatus Eremiobacteraeota bacterium]
MAARAHRRPRRQVARRLFGYRRGRAPGRADIAPTGLRWRELVRVWRLVRKRRLADAFTGEGARLAGGRWNSPGVRVVYTSASLALAMLEYFAHTSLVHAPKDVMAISADVPDDVSRESVAIAKLPARWQRYDPPVEALRTLGDAWIARGKTAVLVVPSAIVTVENNYLLNPLHPDIARVKIGKATPVLFDLRLFGSVKASGAS